MQVKSGMFARVEFLLCSYAANTKYIASQLFKFTFPPFTTVRKYVKINCYVRRIACSK